jgi:hypothetical protein
MIDKDGYYIWKKGEIYAINKDLSTREFTCPCNHPKCIEQRISKDLIENLVSLRELVQEPLIVTSGYRCANYQNDTGDTKIQYKLGNTANIKSTRMQMKDFVVLASKLFKVIENDNYINISI